MNSTSTSPLTNVVIRPATPADTAALASLTAELDYPTEQPAVGQRLATLVAAGDELLVAEYQEAVVGFVLLHRTYFLHRPPDGRIVTLVVTAAHRSQGIGAQLLAAADRIFRQWGCGRIELSSGNQREAAHRFYQREGYVQQSKRFVKPVS